MKKIMVIGVGLLLSVTGCARHDATQTVIDRYIHALGGEQALETVRTCTMHGTMTTDLPSRQPPVFEVDSVTSYAMIPDRQVVVSKTQNKGVVREGFNGPNGWRKDTRGVRPGAQGLYRSKSAFLAHPANALRIATFFPGFRFDREAEIRGRAALICECDLNYPLVFDKETGLLVQLGHHRILEDYRTVDGISMPYVIKISRKGGMSTLNLYRITLNDALESSQFTPPF